MTELIERVIRTFRHFAKTPKGRRLDLGRRTFLTSGALGVGGGLLFSIHPQASARTFNPELIRPPGSTAEEEFLSRCVRCGECMKVCPTNAIHPAFLEAGLEGIWSPVLNMKLGYCEYECTLCTQVCPTDAIQELPPEEKVKTKIGLAFIDRNRCLPYASAVSCIVCEEHCPTPTKAIWFQETEVINAAGETLLLKQPRINAELCIGCGICENKCPFRDRPAIYVTSAGESRNPNNQVLLTEGLGGDPYQ